MDGTLALDVSLATYGTAWLATGGDPPSMEDVSATQYVRTLRLENPRTHVAKTAAAWLGGNAISHVPRLWLVVAEAGHGVGVTEPEQGVWHATWTHADGAWDVSYSWTRVPGLEPVRPDPGESLARLRDAVAEAKAFAERVGDETWPQHFERALDADPPYHLDIVPDGWPTRTLALTAVGAWASGPMGIWDIAVPAADAEDHARITATLHRAVVEAFLAAANA